MANNEFPTDYGNTHVERFNKTLRFMSEVIPNSDKILDLGPVNPFTGMLNEAGYEVENTAPNLDLDLDFEVVKQDGFDVVTAFEIFEHLVSPFPLLRAVKAKKLIASVPLNLWFKEAYWNEDDPFDRHFHEFEPRQFDMLVEKAGWKIIKSEKWINKTNKWGFRPFLRNRTPRHYIVYCERV